MGKEILQTVFGLCGGLAIFIYGMDLMSGCLQKAAGEKMKAVLGLLTRSPVTGVLAGALVTAVLQSSSATTVMAIDFVSAGLMTLPQAVSIILGANIDTTVTALAHCVFNISGCLLFIWFVRPYAWLIQTISPKGPEIEVISRQIANAHTLFNVTMAVLWVPFLRVLVGIVTRLIPDRSASSKSALQPGVLPNARV